ncbi:glycoside hydrolase [Echinicola strongylocentroti]|uniref:beta-N-acetylhexosaminidase n=1 Tax=Echinicola strongylocentroti TaxID=1795355 RepID=A0A2Z4IPN3_9BACT|nr:family 20 glycosylhydrolase [Echinicola strongylocentroti]AWW33032.1 glycoside hydrolase [Echinicola strongylocentroti]
MKHLIKWCGIFVFVLTSIFPLQAQETAPDVLPVRAFAIAAPAPEKVEQFVKFIDEELGPRRINVLILRVEYNYEYLSHPELRSANPLTQAQVKQLVAVCKENDIRIIPQVNLLGHQSWHSELGKLLEVYPEFDETPHVQLPEKYEWPNEDGLYCKSYCPLHPGVHDVVFDLVGEICEVFEADAFHAGMDEVFYIGDDKCPRCGGRDKAKLFADEVWRIRNHLAESNRELWIWGDRLLDGKTTGLGMWEASMNNTYRAIDMIPKDVVIGDWHYERADQTAVYFAMKGLRVLTCNWRKPEVSEKQVEDMYRFRASATEELKPRFYGMMQTVWSSAGGFIEGFYADRPDREGGNETAWHTFRMMFDKVNELEGQY